MSNEASKTISVSLMATDMHQSIRFYRDQLGFELQECWPDEQNPLHCGLVLGTQSVMLGKASPPEEMEKFCADDPAAAKFWAERSRQFAKSTPGAGVTLYLFVEDVDAYVAQFTEKGVAASLATKTQFYGLRTSVVTDPDGYTLTFYTPVAISSCQSCGMPMSEAKPGRMYCAYCTDERGVLRPYEQVFEGTVSGYFMEMQKLSRKEAEKAAREHLKKMPAWAARG
jgi:uncharacterized glyoxalase superfamily protein PhnB